MQTNRGERALTTAEKVALAQAAYRQYRALCFWYARPDLKLGPLDLEWVAQGLRRYGNRETFLLAAKLCP